jgi:cytochrome b involved in lipid metabolism
MPPTERISFVDAAAVAVYQNANPSRFICTHGTMVMDLTDFLQEHPGGVDVMLDWKGKDITMPFEDVGHSNFATEQMHALAIGEIVGDQSMSADDGNASAADAKILAAARRDKWINDWVPLIGAIAAAITVYILVSRRQR